MKHIAKALLALFILTLVVAATSCTGERRATAYMYGHREVAATVCSNLFPATPSTAVRSITTDTTPGATIWVDCDSLIRASLTPASAQSSDTTTTPRNAPGNTTGRGRGVAVNCPPSTTTTIHDSVVVPDRAAIAAEQGHTRVAQATAAQERERAVRLEGGRNAWRTLFFCAAGIIVLWLAVKIFRGYLARIPIIGRLF